MKIPKMKRWQCVVVEWTDSRGGESGWHWPEKSHLRASACVTCGLVYAQNAGSVTVVLSRDRYTKAISGTITIPSVAITKILKLGDVS